MRREPALKLERSPLIHVLAQVRFSPVLKMKEYVPEIQEVLRQQSFSWYREEQIQQVFFGPKIETEIGARWVFATRERHEAVVLTNTFVVYETSRYEVFESFVQKLSTVLRLLKDQVKVEFAEQLGLRYVDLIRAIDGKSPRDLLQDSIRGFTNEDFDAEECRHQFVIKASTAHGELIIRLLENSGNAILPPDLAETHLTVEVKPSEEEVFRILDIDHISKRQRDFAPDGLVAAIGELHEYNAKAFRSAVTPEAIEIWGKKGE